MIKTYDDLLAAFTDAVQKHDLTYSYSDDHRAYTRGREQWQRILGLAAQLSAGEAAAIWNAAVDRKIAEGSRHLFYWKG